MTNDAQPETTIESGGRPQLPECLTGPRCFAILPSLSTFADDGRLITVLEVFAQESIATVALHHADQARLPELRDLFADRLDFGVHGVSDHDQLHGAIAAGAQFVLLVNASPELVQAGIDADVAVLPAALTPTEVLAAHQLGAAAVQIVPADLLGGNYPDSLAALVGRLPLVARGGLGGWSAGRWFSAGVIACGFDDGLLGDAMTGGNLTQLRDRCRTFTTTAKEARPL